MVADFPEDSRGGAGGVKGKAFLQISLPSSKISVSLHWIGRNGNF